MGMVNKNKWERDVNGEIQKIRTEENGEETNNVE